jgi:hypothetical protein
VNEVEEHLSRKKLYIYKDRDKVDSLLGVVWNIFGLFFLNISGRTAGRELCYDDSDFSRTKGSSDSIWLQKRISKVERNVN